MIIAETSFAQGPQEFKKFLAENNLPTDILWIFLEDTFSRNTELYETHFWLKLPLPEENEELAKRLYEIGQQKNFGVSFSRFALCEGKICCGLVIPKDKEDSELLFMPTKYLKFSLLKEMPTAQPVKSSLRWKIFKLMSFKYKQGNFFLYLQSKKDLQSSSD